MRKPLYILICLFSISCATHKPITNKLHPNQVKKVGIISPFNSIKVLSTKKEEPVDGSDFTNNISNNAEEAMIQFFNKYNIESEKVSMNREEEIILQNEIIGYYTKFDGVDDRDILRGVYNFNNKKNRDIFDTLKVSEKVVKILNENQVRFAVSTLTLGFTRTKKSEDNRQTANVGKAVLAAGMFALTGGLIFARGIPYKAITYFFVIDAESKSLTLYSRNEAEIDPTDKTSLQTHISKGLEEYWILHAMYLNSKLMN
jgi:hypothetical protein